MSTSTHIGSLEPGKLADVVVCRPAFFGIKPELVIKGGFIVWSVMGDSAASLMTCEPMAMRPQWGAFGRAKQALSASFVSRAAFERNIGERLGLEKTILPINGVRKLSKRDTALDREAPSCQNRLALSARSQPLGYAIMDLTGYRCREATCDIAMLKSSLFMGFTRLKLAHVSNAI